MAAAAHHHQQQSFGALSSLREISTAIVKDDEEKQENNATTMSLAANLLDGDLCDDELDGTCRSFAKPAFGCILSCLWCSSVSFGR